MWLLYVSIKEYVQTYSLVWPFLTPVRRLECHNFSPQPRTAILAAFSPLKRSHMRRRLTAVLAQWDSSPYSPERATRYGGQTSLKRKIFRLYIFLYVPESYERKMILISPLCSCFKGGIASFWARNNHEKLCRTFEGRSVRFTIFDF